MTPIANLESFGSEWILDTSWITPSATPTLAELIRDLTQSHPAAAVDSPNAGAAERLLNHLFEADPAEPSLDAVTEAAPRFELPQIPDLESKIPPIQPIEIQPLESEPAPPDLTLADLFSVEPTPENAPPELDANPVIEPDQPALDLSPDAITADVAPMSRLAFEPVLEPDSEPDSESDSTLDRATLDQLNRLLSPQASLEPLAPAAVDPPSVDPALSGSESTWFLGIDIGTTGISAVLLNQTQCQLYPLYWQTVASLPENSPENLPENSLETNHETLAAPSKQFRLATTVTLTAANPSASALPTIRLEPAPVDAVRLRLSDWKPYLKLAIPHYSPQTSQWEPVLQWSEQQSVPLRTLQEALQQLLATLHPNRAAFMPGLTCAALGLETNLPAILQNLAGIVVGYPSNWSDTYSFNVREAILQAELVTRPDQIVLVEEPIAALLSALPAADGRPVSLASQAGSGHLHNAEWRGITLILTAGASLTELVLVNLPQQLQQLNPTDFYMRSWPYAGQGIDQDVLSQLLLPMLQRLDPHAPPIADLPDSDFMIAPFDLNEWGLATLSLPAASELDFSKRYRFQQLLGSAVGQSLLAAARSLKVTLQYQPHFTVQFGSQQFTLERQDLTSRVLLPYVQRLNRELNTLLAQTNTTATTVSQVVCTGGTASLGAVARWLRQKLPNATIIQDTYPRSAASEANRIPSCSRVAYGLATVPLHPQVIDPSRHRYSDYFLLLELLRTVPPQPVTVETIMQLLEQRGIDTQTCRFRILALLDGHLPPGLVPADVDLALLTLDSAINPDYQAIQFAPVFAKQPDRTYQPNQPQRDYLQQYLETLFADTEQTLAQPLVMGLGVATES